MISTHDIIRKRLHDRIGVNQPTKRDPLAMSGEIKAMTSKLHEIVELAEPRLIMGGIRYGSDWTHDDLMAYMQKKFDLYRETGNFENLVDFFNFIPIEGELKTHPKFHFEAQDRK